MQRVVFADSRQVFFEKCGLKSFDDFYNYISGVNVNKNTKRNVQMLTLGEGPERKVFFMKRFHNPHFKDLLSARRNFGQLTSQAGAEWNNAHILLRNGIDTYKPVCMGEHTSLGIERKSFFITEQLDSICLLDFVLQKWRTLKRPEQEQIVGAMANLVSRVHKVNISLPDLYIWHIFVRKQGLENEYHLSVIDLHRMARGVTSSGKRAKELGKLYWSMSSEYFDDDIKDLLVAKYVGEGRWDKKDRFTRKIRRSVRTVERRRNLVHHYRRAMVVSAL